VTAATAKKEKAMQTAVYLSFNGNCAEAFRYYEKHLGGKIDGQFAFSDAPEGGAPGVPDDWKSKIMHVSMTVGDTVLMGSDAPPPHFKTPQGFSVSLHTEDAAKAERVFDALADGGEVQMPLAETFWAKRFGMVTDRFGTPWMINCGNKK
jgi:PhnB protein